jgi:hypothetical protein
MKMKNLVNLTPHPLVLRSEDGREVVIPPSGVVARVASSPGSRRDVAAAPVPVPVYDAPTWGAVEGLPEPDGASLFVVSALVAGRCAGRSDVVSPGTGPADGAVRNEAGHIVAVTRLVGAPS